MNKNFKPWSDEKIISLFTFIEEKKKQNINLISCFSEYAKIVNKKPNSIRNYYYNQIEYFNSQPNLATRLNIDLNLHKAKKINHFSQNDENKTINDISDLVNKGFSVRKACLKLADNNIEVMMRLQNKYRSFMLKQKADKTKNNILQFTPKNNTTLSENDINNLFLGLVKVIKRNALEQVNKNLISECEWANNTLRKTLVTLNEKEQTIKALSLKNTVLSKKLIDLTNEVARLTMLAQNNQ